MADPINVSNRPIPIGGGTAPAMGDVTGQQPGRLTPDYLGLLLDSSALNLVSPGPVEVRPGVVLPAFPNITSLTPADIARGFGGVISAGAGGATVPAAITTLAAGAAGDGLIPLTWTAPANGGSAITDYVVQYRTSAGPGAWQTFADGTSAATGATVTGLTNGTGYDFRVMAVNAVGQGPASNVVSGTPAAAAEVAITSVDARGDFVVFADTPAATDPLAPLVIRRSGFNAAGVSTPWNETIIATTRRRQPTKAYNVFTAKDVMLSSIIMAGDTFPNQPGVVNNSTRTPPGIAARWYTRGFRVVGNSMEPIALDVWGPYTRNGTPVARVEVTVADQHGLSVVLVATPAKLVLPRTGLVAHQWITGTPDLSTLTDGDFLTVNYKLFGVYGQIVDSSAGGFVGNTAANRHWDTSGTLFLYKNTTIFSTPIYAYIQQGASGGAVSTNDATARSTPFPTFSAARTAVTTWNNANRGLNGVDGAIFRFRYVAATDYQITVGSGNTFGVYAGCTIEPDPDDTWVTPPRLTGAQSANWSGANSLLPDQIIGHYIRGFDYLRSVNITWIVTAGQKVRFYLENGTVDAAAPSGANYWASITTSTGLVMRNMAFTNWGTDGGNFLYGFNGALIDIDLTASRTAAQSTSASLCSHFCAGVKVGNHILQQRSGSGITTFVDAYQALAVNTTGSRSPAIADFADNGRVSGGRNCLLVCLDGSEADTGMLSPDGRLVSLTGAMFHHSTWPANNSIGAARLNTLYNETDSPTVRDHKYSGYVGCILPATACKGDQFCFEQVTSGSPPLKDNEALSAAREPGYREYSYQVSNCGNWWISRGSDPIGFGGSSLRYGGWCSSFDNSVDGGGQKVVHSPGFVDNRTPTNSGVDGTEGGDYHATATFQQQFERRALWDVEGNDLPQMMTRPGCYGGWAG